MQRKSVPSGLQVDRYYFGFLLLIFIIAVIGACINEKPTKPRLKPESKNVFEIVEHITEVIGNEEIFEITPSTVQKKFLDIVKFDNEELTEDIWIFTGDRKDLGLQWAEVEFQPGEPKSGNKWQLLQIVLGCIPIQGNFQDLYEAFSNSISKRIGRPIEKAILTVDKKRIWNIGKYKEIWLSDGTYENPREGRMGHVILLRIAILQGEPE